VAYQAFVAMQVQKIFRSWVCPCHSAVSMKVGWRLGLNLVFIFPFPLAHI
jgi:hypothetical protein